MRERLSYLIVICFCVCCCQHPFGQQLHFQRYNIKDGLVHSGTGSREVIMQDREGFIWFSTHHGISRFDGIQFKNFRYEPLNPNSIGNNLTVSIVEADDGKIWVGTTDEGLYIFDPRTEVFTRVGEELSGICGHGMNTLNKDQDGNIWIGTRFNGFCRWVKKTGQFERVGQLRDGQHFYQQKDGTVWLGEWNGLYKVMPDGVPRYIPYPPETPADWRYKVMQDQVELPDGKFLLTSSFEGFWEFDPLAESFRDLTGTFKFDHTKVPYSFLAGENGKIWIGADGELWLWDPADGSKTVYRHDDGNPNSIPATMIPSLFKDRAGSLWLITRSDGIAVAHDLDHSFEPIGQANFIQLLPIGNGEVLVWAEEGVFLFDTQRKTLVPADIPIGPRHGLTQNLIRHSDREILFSEGNLSTPKIYNLETGELRVLPATHFNYKLKSVGGRIWASLHYLDEKHRKWVDLFPELQQNIPDFISSMIYFQDLIHDEGNRIWISTTGGVFHYDPDTKQSKAYRHDPADPHSLPSTVCQLMFRGKGRQLYVATTNGLAVYDPEKDHFNNYNQQNGLLHDVVNTVVEDANGNPWIGTALGLQKLDLETGAFSNYNEFDGLPNRNISPQYSCRDEAGWLYFYTGDRGFRFHPDSLPTRDYTAPVYLLDLYQNHEVVQVGGADSILQKMLRYTTALSLPFNKNDFGFSFVMPVFYKPEETDYFYRLLPYQTDWQPAGNARETHYTNIDPGTYTFEVKARTAKGIWSTGPAAVEVVILPPWYGTWWARVLFALLLGASVYGFYKFQLNRRLEIAEAERLKELDILKTRLYTNITHEFRTPLTVIMGMIDNIRGHQNEKKLIHRNSKNLLRLINQLLDLSKLDSGTMKMDLVQSDIINYLQYLTESFYSMAHEKKIRLTFYSEVPELIMDFDEVKIQHVIYNLLSNAIKFTGAGGKVILHVKKTQQNGHPFLQLKLQDTGTGIPAHQLEYIFDRFFQADGSSTRQGEGTGIGLALAKELVDLMDGKIHVESEVGRGTTFTLLLPVKKEAATPVSGTERQTTKTLEPELVPDLPERDPPAPVLAPVISAGEKPTLLIIEDNRDVVAYIESLVRKDYIVEIARNGQEGIDKALETIPDIIVSDVMMPEKDGYEVCHILKNDERSSHIPIILLTAKASTEDRIEGLREGADAYLTKPFNKEELFVRLEKLVALRTSLQAHYSSYETLSQQNQENKKPSLDDLFLQKLIDVVEDRLDDTSLSVTHLCRAVNLSNMQVNRKLKALTGRTPSGFIRSIRLHKAVELLKTTELNVSEIAYEVGFNDPNYFSRAFSKEFGHPPNVVRK